MDMFTRQIYLPHILTKEEYGLTNNMSLDSSFGLLYIMAYSCKFTDSERISSSWTFSAITNGVIAINASFCCNCVVISLYCWLDRLPVVFGGVTRYVKFNFSDITFNIEK